MTVIELQVAPGDLGRVIGRQGRTAAAVRTLLATAAEGEGKRATLDIRDVVGPVSAAGARALRRLTLTRRGTTWCWWASSPGRTAIAGR